MIRKAHFHIWFRLTKYGVSRQSIWNVLILLLFKCMSNWVISIKLTYIKENLENIETVKNLKGSAYIMDNRMKNISENVLWPWPIIFNLAYNYLLWPSHWLGSKFLHTINHKTLFMWSTCMTLIGLSEVYVSSFQKMCDPIWPWPTNIMQYYFIHLIKGTLWVTYEPDWTNRREDMFRRRIVH